MERGLEILLQKAPGHLTFEKINKNAQQFGGMSFGFFPTRLGIFFPLSGEGINCL